MKKLIMFVAFMLLSTAGLFGAGTLSGTDINNTATLDYTVGGVNQDDINASDSGFVVDNKIDFLVNTVDSAIVEVVPGSTDQVLTFTVTNNGNTVQDFSLDDAINTGNPFGESDNIDASNVEIFVDSNSNGAYDAGTDTVTYIDELAPDAHVTVFIIADFDSTLLDGDVSEHTLVAQVATGGTSGAQGSDIDSDDSATADDIATVDIVFADGAGDTGANDGVKDGKHSDNDAYKVVTATITMAKTSIVTNDLVNGTTNPHRIPGATVRYCFTVDNSGSAKSTLTIITDTLDANLSYVNSGFELGDISVACDCDTLSDTSGANVGQDVEINLGTIESDSRVCAYIDTTIN